MRLYSVTTLEVNIASDLLPLLIEADSEMPTRHWANDYLSQLYPEKGDWENDGSVGQMIHFTPGNWINILFNTAF